MKPRYRLRFQRIWPLVFSTLALWGLARTAPVLYRDLVFSRHAVPTDGWYTDLSQAEEYYHYAYRVGSAVYDGRALYDDAHSGIYYRKLGDKIEVMYDSTKPWISREGWNSQYYLRNSEQWLAFYLVLFAAGIWGSTLRSRDSRRKFSSPQVTARPTV
jgi:hypothetical protein